MDNPEDNLQSEDSSSEEEGSGSEVEGWSDEEFQHNLEFAFGQVAIDDEDHVEQRKGTTEAKY